MIFFNGMLEWRKGAIKSIRCLATTTRTRPDHRKIIKNRGTFLIIQTPARIVMLKSLLTAATLASMVCAFGFGGQQKQDDKSTHHAAMHAEHTVHHSAMHAEKWLDHHLSAPHKKKPIKHKPVHHKKRKPVHHTTMQHSGGN